RARASRWPSGSRSCWPRRARPPRTPRPPRPRPLRPRRPLRRRARPTSESTGTASAPCRPFCHRSGRQGGFPTQNHTLDNQRGGSPPMANYTAADVKRLRELTGSGMMDCKNALVETEGDFDKAVELLRIKGAKDVGKRAERTTAEGLVVAKDGVMVEINSETDF